MPSNNLRFASPFSIAAVLLLASCASRAAPSGGHPQKALLVIDMQADYIGEEARYPIERGQISGLIQNTNLLIAEFLANGRPVVYLRNNFKKTDWRNRFRNYACLEGSPGAEIDPRIKIVSEHIFDKYAPDAFSDAAFAQFLKERGVGEISLCGVLADECVYETALGGLKRGYAVACCANAVGSKSAKKTARALSKMRKKGIAVQ